MAAKAPDDRERPAWRRLAVWGGAAALMLLPVFALRIAGEAPSDPGDFVFLLILLAGVGGAWELADRVGDRNAYRAASAIALAAVLLCAWINLAVGIVGSEDDPANLIYAAILAVAAFGAIAARLRPRGMARAMTAAAVAQLLAFAFVLAAGRGFTGPITLFFAALWLISASLFRRAAVVEARSGVGR